ncbi:MAG: formate dehydrogenase accessory sulfurtransferase FdhD [Leptothrix sp. (in: b-proteobacteria)]
MQLDPTPHAPEAIHPIADAGHSQVAVRAVRGAAVIERDDCVAEERPVALVYNGISHAVMLASPLDLEDFALGFSLSEGIIDSPDDLLDFEAHENDLAGTTSMATRADGGLESGLTLELRVTLRCFMRLKERRRTLAGRTGCGLCGTESLAEAVRPVRQDVAPVQVHASALTRAMVDLAERQELGRRTGATHAAAWCALDGAVQLVREDVGRHNALDKLVGRIAHDGFDVSQGFVAVTSRASYEMVYKTASAGIGLLAAISAPTGLAVRTAQSAGLVLAGFTRGDRTTIYTHAERVTV